MVYGNSCSDDEDTDYDDESSLLGNSKRQGEVIKPWNTFKVIHRKEKNGSMAESKFIDYGVVIIKIIIIILVFLLILGSAVTSKLTLLLMTSQIKIDITRPYCNQSFDSTRQYNFTVPAVERATWIWLIMFTYFVPEVLTFIRSVYILMFKTWKLPKMWDFIFLVVTESLPAFGSALLVFKILPELDVVQAAMLTNGFCIIPSLVNILRNIRPPYDKERFLNVTLDILAFTAQISALLIWPINQHKPVLWLIPIASICISFGWWENFVTEKTAIEFIKKIAKAKKDFRTDKYFSYAIISVLKCVLFFATTLIILQLEGDTLFIFRKFTDAFSQHGMDVVEVTQSGQIQKINNNVTYQLIIWLVNISSTYACYFLGRFACKIMIQETCFSYPIAVTVPTLVTILIIITSAFEKDNCFFFDSFPKEVTYLFFNIPPSVKIGFENSIWLIWLLSQLWITKHIWVNKNIKLSPTEQLFMRPMYDAFLIDQSLALNRRKVVDRITKRSEDTMNKMSEIDEDKITRIYACGTMWHEIREEMLEFVKTIFRMDEDQALHRIVKNYLQYPVVLDNYYEWETHIFFDDAFIRKDKNDNDPHINKYVETLLSVIEEAATEVHETTVRIPPPLICPTPYGGRLTWTLPGKTKLIVHLKDKAKIRPKKRWSQVMYMYYLLGHKLLDNENLTEEKATARSKNTYILALDGDIDFQPKAVHLLVQYMKKNPILGATCGRIHPMGSGVIAWYQKFEYAIGHWMQKATEHVFGCVLCSPGCFSLFRASALMDHNVLARYNTKSQEARHYVQYDQGEDRWLCTLLLQRGYKVEYTAASDAYTHCPESFNDFYIQRRRWMPSTMANVLDLLENSKHVTKINDNISTPYIYYQYLLLVTTIIGPGTIFLMLIGALVTVFNLSQWNSLVYNSIPVAIFVLTCVFCESQTQLTVAGIVSGFYGLVMIAVLIGVAIQIISDGLLVPTSLFFLIIMGQYVIAAMLHPKELVCLVYGVIYLITVPSMYMLLVIYSVFNMNNVSWGTREVTVEVKPTNPEENTEEEEEEKETNLSLIVSFIYKIRDFFADCCNNSNLLIMISNSLSNIEHRAYQIERRIDCLENNSLHPESLTINNNISKTRTPFVEGPRASVVSALSEPSECVNYDHYDSQSFEAPSENLHNNSWFYHRDLIKGNVAYLERKEEIFWKELLEKYLKPTQDDKKKVGKELKELRNKMVITFFMLNLLFVLIIFLMTLRKDLLHVQWPFNPSVNFTYTKESYGNEIMIMKTYLQLEPIGLALSAVFFSVMVIQFTCMLRHRFSTFAQIMANSTLNFHLFKPKVENMSHDDLLERDPIKIFKKLIQLKGVNGDDDKEEDSDVARRETVAVLMENKHKKRAMINDLDTAFKERMRKIRRNEDSGVSVPKKTLAAISRRRETILKTQSETRHPHPSLPRTVSFADENDSKESTHHFDNPAFVDDI